MGELCPEWDPGPPPLVRLLSRFVQLTRHKNFAIVTILLSICATAFAIPSCGTFKHTVRPPAATAFSRSSSSTRTTTHHSFISFLSGPIGPTTKNDSMGAVGAATAASASHPALVACSPPLLRSKGIFVNTVRPPAATASSRSSSSTRTTAHYSFISSLSGQIGPKTKNDLMGAVGAAAALSSAPPLFNALSRAV